jgi:Ca2+-binding EF-hand superfamily protein
VAENLSDEEIMGLKEMFRSLDTDNSGTITLEELRSGLPKLGTKISESEIKQLMEAVCSASISICFIVFLLMHNFLIVFLIFS